MNKYLWALAGFFLALAIFSAAYVQAANPITFPINGGTGTSTKPTLGQVLVGQANGTYGPQATSTLGISGGVGGSGTVGTSTKETAGYIPVWSTTNGAPALLTGTSTAFQSGLNLGIGTTTPSTKLSVVGDGAFSGNTNVGLNLSVGPSFATYPLAVVKTAAGVQTLGYFQNLNGAANDAAQIFLGTRASLGDLSVGSALRAVRTNATSSGDTDLVILTSAGTNLATSTTFKSNGGVVINSLTSGLVKSASGLLSNALVGTDYQAPITLTTSSTTGAATFIGNVLNIPQYTGGAGTSTNYFTNSGASTYLSTGTNLGIGTTTPNAPLNVYSTSTSSPYVIVGGPQPLVQIGSASPTYGYLPQDRLNITDNANDYSADNSYNLSSGNCATADKTVANDLNSSAVNFGDLGHTSSGFTGVGCVNNPFTGFGANSTYLLDPSGNVNYAAGAVHNWFTSGYGTSSQKMILTNPGNLGIGTTTPEAQLSIVSSNVASTTGLTLQNNVPGGTSGGTNLELGGTLSGTRTFGALGYNPAGQISLYTGYQTQGSPSNQVFVATNSRVLIPIANGQSFSVGTSTGNAAFQVNSSPVGTGVSVSSAAAGSGASIGTLSTGTNEALNIDSKGAAMLNLGTATTGGGWTIGQTTNTTSSALRVGSAAALRLTSGGTTYYSINSPAATNQFTAPVSVTASSVRFQHSGAADLTLTASTEAPEVFFNEGVTRQHATGALALQRDFRIAGSTHSFVGASTLTQAAAFSVDGPSPAGANATVTNSAAIYVPTSAVTASTTNAYGVQIAATTGAANNYAAVFTGGNVGIGTSTPTVPLQVATSTANATTTIEIGRAGQTKGSCLSMYDSTGAAQYVSIVGGALIVSATSCK